ncbi:MAG: peptide chain release factor N(5)-glutamine methyltransferase [Helicobacter sp.]|nr:peptide chain release factor N(5)-glutamine methyltransferase [Helicobacter sp.]
MSPTIASALQDAAATLAPHFERPRLESEILLCFVLGVPRAFLHAHDDMQLDLESLQRFNALVARRKENEPIEYLTQRVSFYNHTFYIAQGALIPRPESELLVDAVADLIRTHSIEHVVEVGVGSGALLCSLALLFPAVRFEGGDVSEQALAIARKNLARFGLSHRVPLRHCALLAGFAPPIMLAYANLPYIAEGYPLESPLAFEPREALFGGRRGDEILLAFLDEARAKSVRFVACEMGHDQKPSMESALNRLCARNVRFYRDYAGHWRGFVAEF